MRFFQGLLLTAVLLDASLVMVSATQRTTAPDETVGYAADTGLAATTVR